MFALGMAATLFMAGMELDFGAIKGRPLSLGCRADGLFRWCVGIAIVGSASRDSAGRCAADRDLALSTTGLGILMPVFRDGGELETPFGRLIVAAGTVGEVGPIIAMSLLLSQRYSTWQEFGFLFAFLTIVAVAVAVGIRARPSRVIAFLGREMHASTQLPVRISLLMLAALFVLAEEFRIREHLRRIRGRDDRRAGHAR